MFCGLLTVLYFHINVTGKIVGINENKNNATYQN